MTQIIFLYLEKWRIHCGRESKDDVKLHIDHIIPYSKGGLTVENNLQTLCDECNLGKSNRHSK